MEAERLLGSWRKSGPPATASWRLLAAVDGWADRCYGARWNPLYQSGALAVALLLVVTATGLYLLLFYRLGAPWESVARVTEQAGTGRWIRSLHRYASDALLLAAGVHAFRMYAQRRSWGRRALAWVSGVVLVGVVLVCGWTGYVMVWDVQAQVLAVEGARLLDVLPIFSEPISRAFVGERPLPNAFFFLNLFAHVALPVGVALLVWIHVSRVARPVLLPPRGLVWGVVGALTALSVVWPVGMAPQADLLRVPGEVPLDVFYGFWLPVARTLPAWAVWTLATLLLLVLLLIPAWTAPRGGARPEKSVVDERLCTGCEQCALDCPYEAISMVARTDGRAGLSARVAADVCVGCGICAGSCAPMGVGPPGGTGREQLAAARAWLRHSGAAGRVAVVGCAGGAAGQESVAWAEPLLVSCAGSVHTSVIETLLRNGAAGVLVVSCPERDCRNRAGSAWLDARIHGGREAELQERVDRARVRVAQLSARQQAALAAELAAFTAELAAAPAATAGAGAMPDAPVRAAEREVPR
jgi:Pyruvate/2-oxoacid:ferredoxin oxidoreductase delta subunit/coenzyme F420-reducing hydrogenase delta subunit